MSDLAGFNRRRLFRELFADKLSYWILERIRARARARGDVPGIVVPIDDIVGLRIAATGYFELTQIDAVKAVIENSHATVGVPLDRSGAFIDVGANIGFYSISLARYFAATYAFEVNPITFRILEANVHLSDVQNVQCACLGMSDQTGTTEVHLPKGGHLGWASLDPGRHKSAAVPVPARLDTLDNYLSSLRVQPEISLIKIDVEGHELQVLRGARRTLTEGNPVVLFEVIEGDAGRECISMLRGCGYSDFFRFRRGLESARLVPLVQALRNGLGVVVERIDPSCMEQEWLVCAVKADRQAGARLHHARQRAAADPALELRS